MKRYDMESYCPYPGGSYSMMEECPDGEWVRWKDVAPLLRDALPVVVAVADDCDSEVLYSFAADIRQALGATDE